MEAFVQLWHPHLGASQMRGKATHHLGLSMNQEGASGERLTMPLQQLRLSGVRRKAIYRVCPRLEQATIDQNAFPRALDEVTRAGHAASSPVKFDSLFAALTRDRWVQPPASGAWIADSLRKGDEHPIGQFEQAGELLIIHGTAKHRSQACGCAE